MIGYTLASLGLLIVAFSLVAIPLSSSYTVTSNFTSPPWFTKSEIHVYNGTFVFTNSTATLKLSSSSKLRTYGTYALEGEGNASIRFSGVRLFYGFYPRLVGYSLTVAGALIEILLLAKRRQWIKINIKRTSVSKRYKKGKKDKRKGKKKRRKKV